MVLRLIMPEFLHAQFAAVIGLRARRRAAQPRWPGKTRWSPNTACNGRSACC